MIIIIRIFKVKFVLRLQAKNYRSVKICEKGTLAIMMKFKLHGGALFALN